MLHTVLEIINTLGVILPLINWRAVTSLVDSFLKFLTSWLDYKTACKLAKEKINQPVATSSRRKNLSQRTRIRRKKTKVLSK